MKTLQLHRRAKNKKLISRIGKQQKHRKSRESNNLTYVSRVNKDTNLQVIDKQFEMNM